MNRRLLVVGFGPFPGVPVNPTGILAQRIAASRRWQRLGIDARVLVMDTAYVAIPAQLDPALAQEPDAVLMIGVAARAKRVRVETRARNRASRLFPDVSGALPSGLMLDSSGPAGRSSGAAAHALVRLKHADIDAARSHDAGRYLCNASYYRALARTAPTIFLHIPRPADPKRPRRGRHLKSSGRRHPLARAFEDVALALLARGRLTARA